MSQLRKIARQTARTFERRNTPDEIRELARIAVALVRFDLDEDTREALEVRRLSIQAVQRLGRTEVAAAARRAHASV
jgi:hypothetical protein